MDLKKIIFPIFNFVNFIKKSFLTSFSDWRFDGVRLLQNYTLKGFVFDGKSFWRIFDGVCCKIRFWQDSFLPGNRSDEFLTGFVFDGKCFWHNFIWQDSFLTRFVFDRSCFWRDLFLARFWRDFCRRVNFWQSSELSMSNTSICTICYGMHERDVCTLF